MGTHLSVFAERLNEGVWRPVTEMGETFGGWPDLQALYDVKTHGWSSLDDILAGHSGHFSWREGWPEDVCSELQQSRGRGIQRHIPADELMFDCWRSEQVLVANTLPVVHAPLFGDGRQPFPEDLIAEAGSQAARWREGAVLTTEVQDYQAYPHQVHQETRTGEITVTWTETLAEVVPETFLIHVVDRLAATDRGGGLRVLVEYSF